MTNLSHCYRNLASELISDRYSYKSNLLGLVVENIDKPWRSFLDKNGLNRSTAQIGVSKQNVMKSFRILIHPIGSLGITHITRILFFPNAQCCQIKCILNKIWTRCKPCREFPLTDLIHILQSQYVFDWPSTSKRTPKSMGQFRNIVSEACVKGIVKWLHPTDIAGYNCLSLHLIPYSLESSSNWWQSHITTKKQNRVHISWGILQIITWFGTRKCTDSTDNAHNIAS